MAQPKVVAAETLFDVDPTAHVLGMVDILSLIFPYCSKGTLAACARVNRCWEEPSLRELWEEIDDATPMFRLLGPGINSSLSGPRSFTAPPLASAWPRFHRYAGWIRKLSLHIGVCNENGIGFHPEVLTDSSFIASSVGLPLVPHLTSLNITALYAEAVKSTIPLLQPTLRRLTLVLCDARIEYTVLPILAISHHCPLLTHLNIRGGNDVSDVFTLMTEDLGKMVASLPQLNTVALSPQVLLDCTVWNSLSALPHLCSVAFAEQGTNRPPSSYSLRLAQGSPHALSWLPNSFRRLDSLDLCLDYTLASALFAEPLLPMLRQLDIQLYGAPSSGNIKNILAKLAVNAVRLLYFYVTCVDSPMMVLSMEHIQPILVERIKILYIQTDAALDLLDSDALSLAKSLPNLEDLSLASDPVHLEARLTFQTLFSFAQYCPRLTYLSLYLNASPESNREAPDTRYFFTQLEILDFGFSACPSPHHAAVYISAVTKDCNPEVRARFSELRAKRNLATTEQHARLNANSKAWKLASEMIPVIRDHLIRPWAQDIRDLRERVERLSGLTPISNSKDDESSGVHDD